MLLLGYMENRTHLSRPDVDEVVSEFAEEGAVPRARPLPDHVGTNGFHAPMAPSMNPGAPVLTLAASFADRVSQQLDALGVEHHGDRLERLEQGMLRLERVNLQTLALLHELVNAVRMPPDKDGP